MSRALLNKSWRQHPTKHQLYGHLPPIMKTIQVRRTRHAGHCWRSRDELISDVLLWTPHMAEQKQEDQLEHTFSNYVRIRDVAQKTCQRRWTIGKSSVRGSGISVLAAQHDDDDIYIYIYIERERGGEGEIIAMIWLMVHYLSLVILASFSLISWFYTNFMNHRRRRKKKLYSSRSSVFISFIPIETNFFGNGLELKESATHYLLLVNQKEKSMNRLR